jgi:hypothetical protein
MKNFFFLLAICLVSFSQAAFSAPADSLKAGAETVKSFSAGSLDNIQDNVDSIAWLQPIARMILLSAEIVEPFASREVLLTLEQRAQLALASRARVAQLTESSAELYLKAAPAANQTFWTWSNMARIIQTAFYVDYINEVNTVARNKFTNGKLKTFLDLEKVDQKYIERDLSELKGHWKTVRGKTFLAIFNQSTSIMINFKLKKVEIIYLKEFLAKQEAAYLDYLKQKGDVLDNQIYYYWKVTNVGDIKVEGDAIVMNPKQNTIETFHVKSKKAMKYFFDPASKEVTSVVEITTEEIQKYLETHKIVEEVRRKVLAREVLTAEEKQILRTLIALGDKSFKKLAPLLEEVNINGYNHLNFPATMSVDFVLFDYDYHDVYSAFFNEKGQLVIEEMGYYDENKKFIWKPFKDPRVSLTRKTLNALKHNNFNNLFELFCAYKNSDEKDLESFLIKKERCGRITIAEIREKIKLLSLEKYFE